MEIVDESRSDRNLEGVVQHSAAYIAIDQQGTATRAREGKAEIRRHEGFAIALCRAGDSQYDWQVVWKIVS